MSPLLQPGQTFRAVAVAGYQGHRGDVVVFRDPGGWLSAGDGSSGRLVKRVIGIGGDRLRCLGTSGKLVMNDQPLDETAYLANPAAPCEGAAGGSFDVKVPQGFLWVMGDDRADSLDSRGHMGDPDGGFVPATDVIAIYTP